MSVWTGWVSVKSVEAPLIILEDGEALLATVRKVYSHQNVKESDELDPGVLVDIITVLRMHFWTDSGNAKA